MASIAFIVDGDLEKKFLGRICKGTPVRRVGNGHTCPTHVIARQALAEIRIFNNKYNDIVIIVDLEKRNISAEDFERELSTLINNQNPTNACVHVFSKDKCVEDWILADSTSVEKYIGSKVDTSQLSGKGGLKKLLREYDIIYNETTVGVELLESVYCSRASVHSTTLNRMVNNFPITCWWISR